MMSDVIECLEMKSVEMVKCETIEEVLSGNSVGRCQLMNYAEKAVWRPYRLLFFRLDVSVLHITCITHRKNPIYPSTIAGKPPTEDCFLAKATERIFLPCLYNNKFRKLLILIYR